MAPRTTRSMRGLTTDEIINALREGTRDMTTVIFRQVPQLRIFDSEANLLGEPLYRVNFCPAPPNQRGSFDNPDSCQIGDCEDSPSTHWHLLWAVGDQLLYRCRIPENYAGWKFAQKISARSVWGYTITEAANHLIYEDDLPDGGQAVLDGFYHNDVVKVDEDGHITEYVPAERRADDAPPVASRGAVRRLEKLFVPVVKDIKEFRSRWEGNHELILARPQLYLTGLNR